MAWRIYLQVMLAGVWAATLGAGAEVSTAGGERRPATVKVAAVQCSSELGAVDANRKKLTTLVEQAAGAGAKIIVLPETSVTGYLSQDLQTNWRTPGRPMDRAFARGKDP